MQEVDTSILDNLTTLQIFLHLRLGSDHDWGIRETQRALNITSSSTVSWHLEKLQDAGLVEKNQQNRYYVSEDGKLINSVDLNLPQEMFIFNGKLLPTKLIQVSFIFTSIIIMFFISYFYPNLAIWYAATILGLVGVLQTREYLGIKNNIDKMTA